jgi:hypothetical protein
MNKLICLIILVASLSSCATKKTTTINFSVPPKDAKELIARVNSKNNYPEWLNLRGKVSIIKNDQDITLNIDIKSRKDSIIWISARGPFGIEIIRAQLTPDSIYFINRINKTYLIKAALYIKEFINVDLSFYDFQDIITANLKIFKKNYKLEVNEIGFHLVSDNFSYSITNNYRVQNAKLFYKKRNLEFSLEDYQEADNFPKKVTLQLADEEIFETTINYSKVKFNKPQKILFKIPDSYDEIK